MLMRTDRIQFLDLSFDRLTFEQVSDRLHAISSASPYGYVVTPNVDHVVRAHREPELRALYQSADLCVCDSRILRMLARMSGIGLPLVPGSDLAALLFKDVIKPGERVALVGGTEEMVQRLREKFPSVEFLHHAPPMGLRSDAAARSAAATFVASAKARFAFIAVGSPQQEMIANEVREHVDASGLALCIGAGLEFQTGQQKRAPQVLQRLGLEWAHRLATNPRRLWRRYLVDGVKIFPIYLRWRGGPGWKTWVVAAIAASTIGAMAIYGANVNIARRQQAPFTTAKLPSSSNPIVDLPAPNLLRPLSREEAAKENAERPFVDRPDTPANRFVLRTDAEDRDRALSCLAQAVYYEAASEGTDGGRAVAQVVLNRLRHPGYPSTICGVVYDGADRPTGCQFSFTCDGSMQRIPIPWLWGRSRKIAEQALTGQVFGPIGHSTHYHADYVLPYWADSLDKTIQIGRHIFYRLPRILGDARAFSQRYGGTEPPVREPGAALVLHPNAVTQQLATALISDGLEGVARDVEKASSQASSPLVADSDGGTLLADTGRGPAQQHRSRSTIDCAAAVDRKQLAPLNANDMRASAAAPSC
jgi:N-acetylglucosaminyldiphosphoundecaprenol N-acetyl-beta-D-mannosaminyltransferase